MIIQTKVKPKLLELYENHGLDDSESTHKINQQLKESDKRAMAFMRKFCRVQSDYHALIGKTRVQYLSVNLLNTFCALHDQTNNRKTILIRHYC